MKDTFTKLRALISMKSCLIEALRSDLASAAAKIDVLENANKALCRQSTQLVRRHQVLQATNEESTSYQQTSK